jgi:hypothetical protein
LINQEESKRRASKVIREKLPLIKKGVVGRRVRRTRALMTEEWELKGML